MKTFRRSVCAVLYGILMFSAFPLRADVPSMDELGRTIPGLKYPGMGGFAVADFDGDGKEDIVVPASNGTAMFLVIGRTAEGIGVKQSVLLPSEYFQRLLPHRVNGAPHLFVLGHDGILREFAGWPLRQLRAIQLESSGFPPFAIGDIDGDGKEELVTVAGDSVNLIRVYDLASGALRWTMPHNGGSSILLKQMDADPALEIIVDGNSIRVIDGATRAIDWSYDDGYYGCCLASGRFQADGGTQFALVARSISVFQSAPYALAWSLAHDSAPAGLTAADLDHDGFDEIVVGDSQWGRVSVYDALTRQVRFSVPHEGWGIRALATVDIDGKGLPAIAFSSGDAGGADGEVFQLVDGRDGATLWKWDNAQPGPYASVAFGDLDGNGQHEFVYVSQGTLYTRSVVVQLDAMNGTQQWRSPPEVWNVPSPYAFTPFAMRTAHRANHAPLIVVAGSDAGSGQLIAIDGVSHDVLWQLGPVGDNPLHDYSVSHLSTFDLDGDGNDEIVACTNKGFGGNEPIGLMVFSISDGSQQWQSLGMGANFEHCRGVMAGRFGQQQRSLVAAVLPSSIEAYDALTHAHAWSLQGAADGATLLNANDRPNEFVVFAGSQLRFYDSATRTLLRQFDIGIAVSAVRALTGERLVVAADGRLLIVDRADGTVLASSDSIGNGLGESNQLAVDDLGGGAWLIGAGSESGAFRFIARLTDTVFRDGFGG